METNQLLEEREPVHAGHLDIQRHNVRRQRQDFIAGNIGIGSRAYYFDVGFCRQRLPQQLPHNGGIVHNQDLNWTLRIHASSSNARKKISAPSENSKRQIDGDPAAISGQGSPSRTRVHSGAPRSKLAFDSSSLSTAPQIMLVSSPITPATWAGSRRFLSSAPMKFVARVLATASETTIPNRPG